MICSNNEKKQVELWLSRLDGSGSDEEWNAVFKLRQTLADDFPKYLLSSYLSSTKWRERSSFVYHATRYARHTPEALNLGVNALTDKSIIVRSRACKLLAWSLKDEALPHLENAFRCEKKSNVKEDICAAMDAIKHKNSNYFVDRDHTGLTELKVK